jgi:CRP-like cAMP-binding protein
MQEIIGRLDLIYPLTDPFRIYLHDVVHAKTINKKEFLLKPGRICNRLYFIEKGLFRVYYLSYEKEVSSDFLKEGEFIFSATSLLNQANAADYIIALEDSVVHYISYEEMQYAYNHFAESNIVARKLLEKSLQKKESWLKCMRMQRAAERYASVLQHNPELVQRVPSKFLASYLGITEVRLSAVKNHR